MLGLDDAAPWQLLQAPFAQANFNPCVRGRPGADS